MGPNAHTVDKRLGPLRMKPDRSVFIGDSICDVEVSRAAGVPCIGYAKSLRRGDELRAARADAATPGLSVFP
ncbi:HAD family hydrolase [Promicromonospora sp. NFX87]|uniref:HAD family hydrolase n=1 Tax=Promicromonospora sp. NFX87 TaxID=3402691 RepID=UPI003AFA6737